MHCLHYQGTIFAFYLNYFGLGKRTVGRDVESGSTIKTMLWP
jgi:hypothetical protein